MPRRNSVEKPTEDPNVEKRVTRGSLRKSEGGSSAVSTPEKQKDTNKSKNQSPAKAGSSSGKRGRPSKRSLAAAETEDNDNKPEAMENVDAETTTSINNQDDIKDTSDHNTKPAETAEENEKPSQTAVGEMETNETEPSGKKRVADRKDEDEGPSVKKLRSEDKPAGESKDASTEKTSAAATEVNSVEAEKVETKEKSATADAPTEDEKLSKTETDDAVDKSSDSTGNIPDVCSKSVTSEATAEVKATADEVIKENGCHEAGNNGVASDAC